MEKRLNKFLKTLRSNRGGEYLLGEFRDYLSEQGNTSHLSAPGVPQHNGVAERKNKTLMDMVRSMMSYSDLPNSFWGYALETTAYILNLVPSKSVPTTATELWTGRKPSLKHIWLWGCPAHVLKGKTDKLEPRTKVCFLVRYPRETKGGLFYSPKDQKVIIKTNDRFLEEDYVMNHKPRSRIVLEELRGDRLVQTSLIPIVQEETPQESVLDIPLPRRSMRIVETCVDVEPCGPTINMPVSQPEEHDHDGLQESASAQRTTNSAQPQGVSRHSGRVIRQPLWYTLLGESFDKILDELDTGPCNYDEALKDKDAELWQKAMKSKMQSMYFNQVWDLLEPPKGINPIGCK